VDYYHARFTAFRVRKARSLLRDERHRDNATMGGRLSVISQTARPDGIAENEAHVLTINWGANSCLFSRHNRRRTATSIRGRSITACERASPLFAYLAAAR
jgi:hypothetical protein